ncbi:MAG: Glycogen accumulation regulator GarA [Chlamydiae bacterium]|nr:Glycogen accumulation regulator GarA [Chlamydiota bacterium]
MSGYFIAEEGPLAGMIIAFEEGKEDLEWSLGRDPDASDVILEDPMVSRRHAVIRLSPEGFILENLSTVNPITLNGMMVVDPVLIREGDIIQIGSTFFRFTEKSPEPLEAIEPPPTANEAQPPAPEEGEERHAEVPSELHFGPTPDTRWLLKVISGPNTGAEFAMHKSSTYLIGKDPNICDIVFQDLSVSRQHARLTIDGEENAFVEDLGSRNGVIVNGELIDEKQLLSSQDLVALGTTTFLVIDRHEARETIISPPAAISAIPSVEREAAKKEAKIRKDWKELIIPKRHLAIAGVFGAILFGSVFAMLSLFKAEAVIVKKVDGKEQIKEAIAAFPGVKFSFNEPSGKLFLMGNVMTTIDHQELLYIIKGIPFIQDTDDNVIVDELVWQNMNALLSTNPNWVGVSMYGPTPGQFVLRGYVGTVTEAEKLSDYIHRNFDYLDRLKNMVVVEKNLEIEIDSLLVEKGFSSVVFELSNGEIVLSGRVDKEMHYSFDGFVNDLGMIPGIRIVKNYVITTTAESSRIDITKDFQITGYSKQTDGNFFIVINGRILEHGDHIDGMKITKINPRVVLLEREGMLYKIDYSTH